LLVGVVPSLCVSFFDIRSEMNTLKMIGYDENRREKEEKKRRKRNYN
jgi:hypothetical protein